MRAEERAWWCIDVRIRGSCHAAAVNSPGARRGCVLLHADHEECAFRQSETNNAGKGWGSGGGRAGGPETTRARRETVRWATHLRFGSARVCLDHAGLSERGAF